MVAAVLSIALWGSAHVPESVPSRQSVVFYNARLALRDGRHREVLKLWLLRNALQSQGESTSEHDADFRSAVLAALGNLGLCQDGLGTDAHGAGLWPIALHNWIVRNLARPPPPERGAPFDAFDVGRQRRFVSLQDVLSHHELRSVKFYRTECLLPLAVWIEAGLGLSFDAKDRLAVARLLRHLLTRARGTLVGEKVEQLAIIEARIFDLDLAIVAMVARKERRAARARAARARASKATLGVKRPVGTQASLALAPEDIAILEASLGFSIDAWLSLQQQRRLFLFDHARAVSQKPEAMQQLVLGIMDALVARGDGAEVEQWIARLDADAAPALRRAVFAGERGMGLLSLDDNSGFRERAVMALHRGPYLLEAGNVSEALRSFAFALHHGAESRAADAVLGLCRRWLSYVLSRHRTDEEVLTTLAALVPRHEFNAIIEDLAWRAALAADQESFARCTEYGSGKTAFDMRMARLAPLAAGRVGEFLTGIGAALSDEPHLTLRFLRQFVDKLEAEEGRVRRLHARTLQRLLPMLVAVASANGAGRSRSRTADGLIGRSHGILDGLVDLERAQSSEDKARGLAPVGEIFAGSIRLAPTDPLPWPFRVAPVSPPSVFVPIALEPVEWRDGEGDVVFGWRIRE